MPLRAPPTRGYNRCSAPLMPLMALVLVTGLHCTARAESWSLIATIFADGDLAEFGREYAANLEYAARAAGWPLAVQLDSGDDGAIRRVIAPGQATVAEVVPAGSSESLASRERLADFLAWARERTPADRCALVVYEHGNSASGRRWDGAPGGPWPALAMDLTAGADPLEPAELATAIERALRRPADLIVLDCCYAASLEVLWELRGAADVIAASPGRLSSRGLHWQAMLPAIPAGADAEEVALDWAGISGQPLGVIRVAGLDGLGAAVSRLAPTMTANMREVAPLLAGALSECPSWGSELEMRDLSGLCPAMLTCSVPEVSAAAQRTLRAVDACLLSSDGGITVPVAGGLGGVWPGSSADGFTESSGWGNMTRTYRDRLRQLLQLTGQDRRHDGAAA